jgi:hypothetical protein
VGAAFGEKWLTASEVRAFLQLPAPDAEAKAALGGGAAVAEDDAQAPISDDADDGEDVNDDNDEGDDDEMDEGDEEGDD